MVNSMFNFNHYVPLLKAKDGEFGALSELPKSIKSNITPVIDIFSSESKSQLEKRLAKIAKKIEVSWGNDYPIFVDLFGISLKERVAEKQHPLTYIFDTLRNLNIKAIPLTGFDRDEAYDKAIENIVKVDNRGICIRLLRDDMEDCDELADKIESLINNLNISYEGVHLLLDFRELKIDEISEATRTAINVIRKIPNINQYCTLTVASSGFPGSLKEIATLSSGRLPRTDYQLRTSLIGKRTELKRLPSFGDYCIQHPDLLELDWKRIPMVPNIRYTLPDDWLIIRGGSNKKYGYEQGHQLSKELISMPEYYGKLFSAGDNYISLCSEENVGPGNMTTWRKVGTNHHITVVVNQLANSSVF